MERFLANFPSQRSQFTTIASQQHTHCSKIGLLEGNSNIGFWLSVLEHHLEHTVGSRALFKHTDTCITLYQAVSNTKRRKQLMRFIDNTVAHTRPRVNDQRPGVEIRECVTVSYTGLLHLQRQYQSKQRK